MVDEQTDIRKRKKSRMKINRAHACLTRVIQVSRGSSVFDIFFLNNNNVVFFVSLLSVFRGCALSKYNKIPSASYFTSLSLLLSF